MKHLIVLCAIVVFAFTKIVSESSQAKVGIDHFSCQTYKLNINCLK